jgi:hypothetical protein
MMDNWLANSFNEYTTLMNRGRRKQYITFNERLREVANYSFKYMDEKILKNMVKRYWKKRKWKPDKMDSIWDDPNTTQEEKFEVSNKWATEIKETLRGGGAFRNLDNVKQLVGQRFSKKGRNHR